MNLSDLIVAVERRAGVQYDPAATAEALNEALQAISVERDWWWLDTSWSFTGDGEASTFVPPAMVRRIRSVTRAGRLLPLVSIERFDDLAMETLDGWAEAGGSILIAPTPADGIEFQARGVLREPILEADTDEPLMPVEWQQGWLVNFTAAILLERVDDMGRADRASARADEAKARMIRAARRATGPHRVRVRPGSML